ncbi:MAG: hypothetical protein ACXVYV_08695 [Gaiellales bacterium]
MVLLPWYAILCGVQGALVAAPCHREPISTRRLLGVAVPAAAMVIGVGAIQLLGQGAQLLAWLAALATPLLAAAAGWSLRWPRPVVTAVAVIPVYVIAWQGSGHLAQFARAMLVGGACLTLAAWLATFADVDGLAVGLVVLVGVDAYLVWGVQQVAPASVALHHALLPSVGMPGLPSRPLPPLQDVTLGDSMMGWLDLFAPAVLAMLVSRSPRLRLATSATVTLGAFAWGLLLLVTSPIPATVPVLAGLAVLYHDRLQPG